jgi:two-component system, sensor histidine kinase and response regulator
MNRHILWLFQFIKRKEIPLYLVLLIALMSTAGWLSGAMGLASFSPDYIPIAPTNIVILIVLSATFLFRLEAEKSQLSSFITTSIILLALVVCVAILIVFLNGFSLDIEGVIVKNPARFGNVVIGRISPISSSLYIFICIGILCLDTEKARHIGGSVSLLVLFISSILLIGYLYNAPLLYGSNIIPVSLPSSICFFLFSGTLLRLYGFRYWTFNLIKDNKVQHLLLKSFLPIVIFIIILQGFLDTAWSFNHINPPLTGAFILLIVIALTTVIVYRVSAIIGAQLLKAENQLKESEEKFRSTMEHSADAIFITDQFGKYIYANKTASGMLGYTFEELTSKTFSDISHPDKKSEYYEIFKQVLAGQGIFTEIELLKKDGEYISTDLNAVLLPDGTIYGSCRDITQRKNDENKVRVLNSKLSELNADKDRFIAILGHDLKSPFNNLLGLSDILLENLSILKKKEIEELASNINLTARKTYVLLDDILMWARIQQGQMPFSPQLLDVKLICNQVLEVLGMAVQNKHISVEYSWQDDIMVFADSDMLKTILRNLISNAIKFTNHEGIIRISAVRTGENTHITVYDNGVGIKPENLSKLFNITEVLSTPGTEGESGTGLGLLLCKEFVDKHRGKIWAESSVGKGSQFHVTI